MAIVQMKHLRLIAPTSAREALLRDLSKLGCVEISEPAADAENAQSILKRGESSSADIRWRISRVKEALETLMKYTGGKRGLFAAPRRVSETELFDPGFLKGAETLTDDILDAERDISASYPEENRLSAQRESMVPWKTLDVPLDTPSSKSLEVIFSTAPSSRKFADVKSAAEGASPSVEVFHASSDRELHYFLILCHAQDSVAVNDALRPFGLNRVSFKGVSGTASENIAKIDADIARVRDMREKAGSALAAKTDGVSTLEGAYDALNVLLRRELACENLMETRMTFILDGWFPARESKNLSSLLDLHGCAYELRDPYDDEEPPVLPYSMKLFNPFGMITNMYSPPSYRGIDPNPFMALFFSLFFGIMLSDAAYGLILVAVGAVVLFKFKPRGGIRDAMVIITMCGISTFIWGALFGGFFGDAISSVYTLITGKPFTYDTALWFNPLNDPIKMMILSFTLGGIHIFAGMAIKAYMLIRDGHFWDAVFDIGFWWILFAGLIFMLLGLMPVGSGLAIAGALGLVLTQGRHEKKLIKKFTKGISSLYDIISYFGDVLSYSRLLALSLATAVVASVMNTMGVMTGPIGFVIVFIIGHIFNLAINLVGSYVHTARLQYVEFFGKFYESGGSLFDPLDTKTKYVDIIKEEN